MSKIWCVEDIHNVGFLPSRDKYKVGYYSLSSWAIFLLGRGCFWPSMSRMEGNGKGAETLDFAGLGCKLLLCSLGPDNTSNWPLVDSLETSLRASWLSIFWSLFFASYLSGCLLPLQLLVFQWQLPADVPCWRQWLFYAGSFVGKTCLVSPFCTVWCTAG